jgi:phosphatidylserine decarboxylase
MLQAFDIIIRDAPDFEDNAFLGFPINVILNWPMGTDAGLKLFLLPKINAQLKKVLGVWAQYLSSPESRSVLTTMSNGWFGPMATTAMPNFAKTFICDPNAPYHGFASWDDFFTRRFRPGVRPVDAPCDDAIINSACEASVYRIAHHVRLSDTFWLKGEPYSLNHMLNNDELASRFVEGTIYQAYLSAVNYHRWASPVNGTIVKTTVIPSAYYTESPAMGFSNPDGPYPVASMRSQGYLTSVATRATIYIKADNVKIGLMVFLAVGMAEVSTCDVTVKPDQRVRKGDQLGMFHFGGSTHCLIFRPETRLRFYPEYTTPNSTVLLNAAIAKVER